ncbi:MAG: hypothetical protein V8R81_07740 [Clostridia bacterium]
MGAFPFFGFPYNRYYYNNFRGTYPHLNSQNDISSVSQTFTENDTKSLENVDNSSISTDNEISEDRKISSNMDEPIFEILGISLYLDDIIILCLLFFLYTEGVQDELLFIVLILLLLS